MSKWGKCVICGREDRYKANGMCTKHYDQWYKYGKVLDNNPRNQKDPNEIVIHDDYAEIILYEGKTCYEVDRALRNLDDINVGSEIILRTPMKCHTKDFKICKKCFGEKNNRTKYIGVVAAQCLTERLTQLSMRSFA